MKRNIPVIHREGQAHKQAHVGIPKGQYERELGEEGFFGATTHMLHSHPPTAWVKWEGPLQPRAFDLNLLSAKIPLLWDSPILLYNHHVEMRYWHCLKNMDKLVRNGDGDSLLFIHEGSGDLYCDYGHLPIEKGDYVLLPRGTMWRLEVKNPITLLFIQATNDRFMWPDRGMLGAHAIFDPACLRIPAINDAFKTQQQDKDWQETKLLIKRHNQISTVTYPFNPLDAVGWKGDLMPVAINWREIRPVMSHRYHIPPSIHTTFLSKRFVVCTFCPRPIESDPEALKVPFFHNNDDYDEVIFYHDGDFFSRDNIKAGMITFHPSGFTHGPHPKAFAAGERYEKKMTDEVAVMVDTRDALHIGDDLAKVEDGSYVNSWQGYVDGLK